VILRLQLKTVLFVAVFLILSFTGLSRALSESKEKEGNPSRTAVPILVYHRFGPVVADTMTVTTHQFESHVRHIIETGYTFIPLRQLVAYHLGKRTLLPDRPVAITVDDGHKSVYTDLSPLVMKYKIPVTLFLYPSAISNASYAMTWDQLKEIKAFGLFDFQSHTYLIGGELRPSDDALDARWFGPGEIEGVGVTESTKQFLKKIRFTD